MQQTPQSIERRAPVCGIASAAVPFVGAGVGYVVLHSSPGGEAGWYYLIYALVLFLASLLAGVVLAVIGTTRHERFGALPWIALFLNVVPLLYILLSRT
jgi:hypothetical protein